MPGPGVRTKTSYLARNLLSNKDMRPNIMMLSKKRWRQIPRKHCIEIHLPQDSLRRWRIAFILFAPFISPAVPWRLFWLRFVGLECIVCID
jgi:hypothetical protein